MDLALANLPLTKRCLIGVSGGRDSTVLLHVLYGLGYKKLVVCHVNHALRGKASTQDAAFVKRLAERLGFAFEGIKMDVALLATERKASVETIAREVRLEFFASMARKYRCPRVLLAHHAEDQAETVLMRVLRGTGIGGLAGMSEESGMTAGKTKLVLLRPMLNVRRREIDAYVETHGIAFREDATNAETKATRNRMRHDLLPVISEAMGQDVTPMLARLARIARRDDDLLSGMSAELAGKVVQADGSLVLTVEFKAAHLALQHRVIHEWLQACEVSSLTNEAVEAAVRLITQRDPARINLPGGLQLRRKAGRLMMARQ
ncbi:MAG: lysidine tils n: trna(ile)-lysidine synthetase [Verrucomicrobiaceae bacterium]|nr:lysidine tils n: trna(ile)-lysidine synthetase [Verrucomicrobiaceae bacterium]